jgi:predicted DNA-binding transcriptional regulator AlpA
MATKFLRVREILERRGGGHSKLYSDIAAGLWPPMVKFGRASVQPEHEVSVMLAAVTAGASERELRELVAALMSARRAEFARWGAAPSAA